MKLREQIAPLISGDVLDDNATLRQYSRDTSIFEQKPEVVTFPKTADDVSAIVRFVAQEKRGGRDISLAARSAGTDMTGGSLTHHVSLVFTKFMNRIVSVDPDTMTATAEPGVYYRDFEKETLAKTGGLLASYPASRQLCAIGGIVSNNSGGELTLRYGKTNRFLRQLSIVLSDGSQAVIRPLSQEELAAKEAEDSFEGSVYKKVHALIEANRDEIRAATPTVTKNSAGYALWNVEKDDGTFDLTQLVCGSQGTLALVTQATLALTKPKTHRAMLVVFLSDLGILPEIVKHVRSVGPESFESYDNHTFSLAVRFLPQMLSQMGVWQMIRLGLSFIPELWMTATGGIPKLVLMAEFAEDTHEEALEKARRARLSLQGLAARTHIAKDEVHAKKYWTIRRESFALLRKNMKGLYAAPFIDDFVVHPDDYPTFLPELNAILDQYHLTYTIAGHIGDANFHIIPLMDLSKPESRQAILELQPKVYELVSKYHGSITGEHNDGIVRTPYLGAMFSPKMLELFAEVKRIFDPDGILNPGKKVGGTVEDIEQSMIQKM
ncbi:FAD-binding oxidoreductase [Candidatus Kaiserbacteria bacterium]|nr:FAD-binding oxidoreductase [Candidatus Kaiserbacteria bacterium]